MCRLYVLHVIIDMLLTVCVAVLQLVVNLLLF